MSSDSSNYSSLSEIDRAFVAYFAKALVEKSARSSLGTNFTREEISDKKLALQEELSSPEGVQAAMNFYKSEFEKSQRARNEYFKNVAPGRGSAPDGMSEMGTNKPESNAQVSTINNFPPQFKRGSKLDMLHKGDGMAEVAIMSGGGNFKYDAKIVDGAGPGETPALIMTNHNGKTYAFASEGKLLVGSLPNGQTAEAPLNEKALRQHAVEVLKSPELAEKEYKPFLQEMAEKVSSYREPGSVIPNGQAPLNSLSDQPERYKAVTPKGHSMG